MYFSDETQTSGWGRGNRRQRRGGAENQVLAGRGRMGGRGEEEGRSLGLEPRFSHQGKKKKTKEEAALDQMYSNPGSVSATFII